MSVVLKPMVSLTWSFGTNSEVIYEITIPEKVRVKSLWGNSEIGREEWKLKVQADILKIKETSNAQANKALKDLQESIFDQ